MYEQADVPIEAALQNELRRGLASRSAEGLGGAARFAGGAGRRVR